MTKTTQDSSAHGVEAQLHMLTLKAWFQTDLFKAHGTNTPRTATSRLLTEIFASNWSVMCQYLQRAIKWLKLEKKRHFLSGDTAQSHGCLRAAGQSHANLPGCCLILNISPGALWKIFEGCWPRIGLSNTCKATLVSSQRIHFIEGPRQWTRRTEFQGFQNSGRKFFQSRWCWRLPPCSFREWRGGRWAGGSHLSATDTGARSFFAGGGPGQGRCLYMQDLEGHL